jgi:hypothetical protein
MRFGNTLIILLILIVLAAVVTEPGLKDFEKYLAEKGSYSYPPLIKHNNSFGFSIFDAEFYGPKQQTPDSLQKWTIGPVKKERYLGLFGNFWKL